MSAILRVLTVLAVLITGSVYASPSSWNYLSAMETLETATRHLKCGTNTKEYKEVSVHTLGGVYVTKWRSADLKRLGISKVPGMFCGDTLHRIAIPSSAGNAPLHWAVTSLNQGQFLNWFVTENPSTTKARNEGGVDFTKLRPGIWVVATRADAEKIRVFEKGGKNKAPTPKPRPEPSTHAQAPTTQGRAIPAPVMHQVTPQSAPPTRSGETQYRKSGVQSPASASCAKESPFGYADPKCHSGRKDTERPTMTQQPERKPQFTEAPRYTPEQQAVLGKVAKLAGKSSVTPSQIKLGKPEANGATPVYVDGILLPQKASPSTAKVIASLN